MLNYNAKVTPVNYVCGSCGRGGCKLWRLYQTFLDHQKLFCFRCAGRDQKVDVRSINSAGTFLSELTGGRTDQIGWLVPAVPDREMKTYWGYTSIPQEGYRWWLNLPN